MTRSGGRAPSLSHVMVCLAAVEEGLHVLSPLWFMVAGNQPGAKLWPGRVTHTYMHRRLADCYSSSFAKPHVSTGSHPRLLALHRGRGLVHD